MRLHTLILLVALCLPLLVACGDRSTHRSADRSQRVVGQNEVALADKQALTDQDVATSKTRRGAKTRSVAASSYKETPARTSNTQTDPAKEQTVVQPTQPTNRTVVQDIVQGDTKVAEVKAVETKPVDKPLTQKPEQTAAKPATTTPPVAVASGPVKVLVEGCLLKEASTLGAYSVVAGSFNQPESAVNLIRQLAGMNIFPFFVLNEKGMYRLIIGTFDDRDEADYQVLKLDVESIKAWVLIR
jgi:hypothetical protein